MRSPKLGGATTAPEDWSLLALLSLAALRWRQLVFTVLAGITSHAATLIVLGAGGWIVGSVLEQTRHGQIWLASTVMFVGVLVSAVSRWWQAGISHDFAFALIENIQLGIFDGLERAAPGYVLGQRVGDLAARATGDAEMMENFYAHILADYVAAIFIPACTLVLLYFQNWRLALSFLPFVLLLVSIPLLMAQRSDQRAETLSKALGHLNADVAESVQGIRDYLVFGGVDAQMARLRQKQRSVTSAQGAYGRVAGQQYALVDLISAFAILLITALAVLLHLSQKLPVSSVPYIFTLVMGTLLPVAEVTVTARKLGILKAGANRIVAILRQPQSVGDEGTCPKPDEFSIRFDGVAFRYSEDRLPALENVTFSVRQREMVALVGDSGAGKSTCVSLLLRFWDVGAGAVRIGLTDIRDLPLGTVRSLVSVVSQDVYLFNVSVLENIRLGCPHATAEEVRQAANLAYADEFIKALPHGYETICGEGGASLSGGQRQRVAIARAIVRRSPILVLDEASSNLDPDSELAIRKAVEQLRATSTILVIAHKPETIRAADRVVLMKAGRVLGDGDVGWWEKTILGVPRVDSVW
jgi:ATP-binding cassette, subfamily C, bacterial CydC